MGGPTETYSNLKKTQIWSKPLLKPAMNSLSHMFKQRHLVLLIRKSRVPYRSDYLLLVFFRLKRLSNLGLISDHPHDAVEI